jgi:hypothetical protein
MPRRTSEPRGAGLLGCLVWLVLLAALGYAGWRFGVPYVEYLRFKEEMLGQAQAAHMNPDEEIRAYLGEQATRLGIPLKARDVRVVRRAGSITISAGWSREVVLPRYRHTLHFQPSVSAKLTSELP